MPSAYQCRKSANLSRIAYMVYGAVPARVQPEPVWESRPAVVAPPRLARKSQRIPKAHVADKGGKHHGD